MLDINEIKKVNEEVLMKSIEKVKKALMNKNWDCECFEIMNEALENLYRIQKYEEKMEAMKSTPIITEKEYKDPQIALLTNKVDAKKDTTEFEALIYEISKKRAGKEGMLAITTILAEHMEDMRILNNRAYKQVMMKLKELL